MNDAHITPKSQHLLASAVSLPLKASFFPSPRGKIVDVPTPFNDGVLGLARLRARKLGLFEMAAQPKVIAAFVTTAIPLKLRKQPCCLHLRFPNARGGAGYVDFSCSFQAAVTALHHCLAESCFRPELRKLSRHDTSSATEAAVYFAKRPRVSRKSFWQSLESDQCFTQRYESII